MPREYDLDDVVKYYASLTELGSERMHPEERSVRAIREGFGTTKKKATELLYDAVAAGKLLMFQSSVSGQYITQLKVNDKPGPPFKWDKPDGFQESSSGHYLDWRGDFQTKRPAVPAGEDSNWVVLPLVWETLSVRLKAQQEEANQEARARRQAEREKIQALHGEDLRYIHGLLAATGVTRFTSREISSRIDLRGEVTVELILGGDRITALAEVLKQAGIKPVDVKYRKSS